ncbi:(+)-neomenthol dehydrogenase-like [Phragmites australis]|uniref:(+)-neomenthol dehydrogenase-like n=1 Tax=Phragmites australis TaxID=29695 RepID=UPI002D7952AF|nr:(+)-neomenthol dehydrogenase-like [Phragmites australis]
MKRISYPDPSDKRHLQIFARVYRSIFTSQFVRICFRVAVVTGGNKGIGLEVCRQLASNGAMVILTARDEKRRAKAVEMLHGSGVSDVEFHLLDVSDPSSAACLAEFIKEKFGRLDILINNAGVIGASANAEVDATTPIQEVLVGKSTMERLQWLLQHSMESYEEAEECLKINYFGTKYVAEAFLPLLQSSDGRLINVSSNYGLLRYFSGEDLKNELNDVDKLTVERLDQMSESFLKDYKNDQLKSHGWPADAEYLAYKVSKALINGYTRILAKKHPELRINSVHPGYCKTDINFDTGEYTAEEGASCIVAVALLPEGGPTGAFFSRTEGASFV